MTVWGSYETIPYSNTNADHFDVIIVLGLPADDFGNPTPEQRERVLEGVREYKNGRAGHIIMTGGAAHNHFVEGKVMATFAERLGVPASDVVVEGVAENTVQNIFYSKKIMDAQGWRSAEVVSSPSHLRRAALILEQYKGREFLEWRTRASKWPPEYRWDFYVKRYTYEVSGTVLLRWFGFRWSSSILNLEGAPRFTTGSSR